MTSDTSDTKRFTLRINADLARRMAVLAATEGKSREEWIREALELVATRQEAANAR